MGDYAEPQTTRGGGHAYRWRLRRAGTRPIARFAESHRRTIREDAERS